MLEVKGEQEGKPQEALLGQGSLPRYHNGGFTAIHPNCFFNWDFSAHPPPHFTTGKTTLQGWFLSYMKLLSIHLCLAFHLSVWTHWFSNTPPFSGFLLFWVLFNLPWLLSFLLLGMVSLLSIQIHHVLVDAPDATSRNLSSIPLRLCPHKLLHKHHRMLFHTKSQNAVPCLLGYLFVCVCWLYHINIQRNCDEVCISEFFV